MKQLEKAILAVAADHPEVSVCCAAQRLAQCLWAYLQQGQQQ